MLLRRESKVLDCPDTMHSSEQELKENQGETMQHTLSWKIAVKMVLLCYICLYLCVALCMCVYVCVCFCMPLHLQEMLSPRVARPMSNRDKVLLQCDQRQPMSFDDFLAKRCVCVFQSVVTSSAAAVSCVCLCVPARVKLVHGQVTIIFVVSVCLFVQSFSQPSLIRFQSN